MKVTSRYSCLIYITLALNMVPMANNVCQAGFREGAEAYDRGDYKIALEEFRKAAKQGNASAQYRLGRMYADGEGVSKDNTEAAKWFRKAAEQGFTPENRITFLLGLEAFILDDYKTALENFRKAAEQGYAVAQYLLGAMYNEGRGVPENDTLAVKWYRKAAEQGYADAYRILGFMYATGQGVPKYDTEAVKWYRKAAEQGDATAQLNLGIMYNEGRGMPENDTEAVKWYRKAAEQGHAKAQYSLGVMYATGQGVPENYIQAYAWVNLSAAQDEKRALELKEDLRVLMTPPQIAEAQKLSHTLYERIHSK